MSPKITKFHLAILIAAMAIPAMATAQEAAPQESSNTAQKEGPDDFTFIAPGDNDPGLEEFNCGIRFGFRRVIDHIQGGSYGTLTRTGPTTASLETFTGSADFSTGKGFRHKLSVLVGTDSNRCSITFRILEAEHFKKGLINLWKDPEFTAADVLTQKSKFLYRPSFTSSFPAASLMANFDRLAVKDCANVGYLLRDSIPGDLQDAQHNLYCVKIGDHFVPTMPECSPYREGSMCRVLTVLRADRSGNTFDATASADRFRKAIQALLDD